MNKFPFAYRPKASNYVVCHLFSLRSALGFCRRSSPAAGQVCVWFDYYGKKKSKVFTSLLYMRVLRNYISNRLMCLKPVLADAGVGDEGDAQRGDVLH